MRRIWHNGALVREEEAVVSLYDQAMMNGDAIFEMMRTFGGRTFRLREHLLRLFNSAVLLRYGALGQALPYSVDHLVDAHEELLAWHQLEHPEVTEWRTMIEVTRGPSGIYQHLKPYESQVFITCYPLKWVVEPCVWKWKLGVAAHTISSRWGGIYAAAKHRSRLELDMAARTVAAHGDEAVLIDGRGLVLEAPGANVIIYDRHKGALRSPDTNCLPGITRNFVAELADEAGIPFLLEPITVAELANAREVLFTCTPLCIYPARRVNGAPLPGAAGGVYLELARRFREAVGVDFENQELIG